MTKQDVKDINQQVEEWAAKQIRDNTVSKPSSILLPKGSEASLASQTADEEREPRRTFVMADDEQAAADQRVAAMTDYRHGIAGIKAQYGSFIDERILKNPKSVFEGPQCRWHFAWIEDYDKSREMQRLDQASGDFLMMMMQDGYLPADFRKIGDLHVTGEEAALIAIPRTRNVIQAVTAKNQAAKRRGEKQTALPPQLPPHLWDKFGTILPPVISPNGSFWIGRHRLYMIESVLVRQREYENRMLANRNLHETGNGISQEPGAGGSVQEIDLDAMFGGRTFGR